MNNRLLLMGIFTLSLLIPGLYILSLESIFNDGSGKEEVMNTISGFRLRIWLSWVVMIAVAIYNKWTTGSNIFFKMIYFLMVLSFAIEGFYIQRMINMFDFAITFEDTYSYGIFISLVNIVMVAGLTAFVQASVWWFTRKWHRR